jgi:tetratricopeptide (TPR) repeat protein
MTDPSDPRLEALGDEFQTFVHEEALRLRPDDVDALAWLASTYTRRGRLEDGLALDRRLVELRPEDPIVRYNLACSLSLTRRLDEAVERLRQAIALGYSDFEHLERDADLENLRGHPGFEEILRRA